MRYLMIDLAIAGFDVDVGGAALQRVEHRRVDELDDRRLIRGEAVDRERLFAGLVVLEHDLDPEFLGRLLENALGRLALLEDLLDRAGVPTTTSIDVPEQQLELVDHRARRTGRPRRSGGPFAARVRGTKL